MNLTDISDRFVGRWLGRKHLWLESQTEPSGTSESELLVLPIAKGRFLRFDYRWSHQGVEQEGVLLIGNANDRQLATAAWVDSWHMGQQVMPLQGSIDAQGAASLLGAYPVPLGPDWGWRIGIMKTGPDDLRIVMHNISPEGEKQLAVRADYRREG
jgi:hypothetical protein